MAEQVMGDIPATLVLPGSELAHAAGLHGILEQLAQWTEHIVAGLLEVADPDLLVDSAETLSDIASGLTAATAKRMPELPKEG